MTDPTLSRDRADILRLAAGQGAKNVRVLGSRARGEGRAHSDIDLLLDFFAGADRDQTDDLLNAIQAVVACCGRIFFDSGPILLVLLLTSWPESATV